MNNLQNIENNSTQLGGQVATAVIAYENATYFGIKDLLGFYSSDDIGQALDIAYQQSFKIKLAAGKSSDHDPYIYGEQISNLIGENVFINGRDGYIYRRNSHGIYERYFLLANFDFTAITNVLLLGLPQKVKDLAAKQIQHNLTRNVAPNSVIQFRDCYIAQNDENYGNNADRIKVYAGIFDGPPRYILDYDMLNVYESRKILAQRSEEVEDILLHISNYDEEMKDYLTKILSTMFMNDHKTKQFYNSMMINIYGETGENGKSTFINLLSDTLNTNDSSRNCCSTSLSSWSKPEYLYGVVNSLLAVDPDSSASTLNNSASEVVKKVVTGDNLVVKMLYSQPEEVQPSTLVLTASNTDIKSWDKTSGWSRRILKLDVQKKLDRPSSWFSALFSDASHEYLIQKLFITFIELLESGQKLEEPQAAKDLREEYKRENNNALEFAHSIELGDVLNKSTKLLYDQYVDWCRNEYDGKPLARITFKAAISEVFGVVAESKPLQPLLDKTVMSAVASSEIPVEFATKSFESEFGKLIPTSIYRYNVDGVTYYLHGPKSDKRKKIQFFIEQENADKI